MSPPVFTSPPSPPPPGLRLQVTASPWVRSQTLSLSFPHWFVHSFVQQTLIELFLYMGVTAEDEAN